MKLKRKIKIPLEERVEPRKIQWLTPKDRFYSREPYGSLGPIKTFHLSGGDLDLPYDVLVRIMSSYPDQKPDAYEIIGKFEGTQIVRGESEGSIIYEVKKLPKDPRKKVFEGLKV